MLILHVLLLTQTSYRSLEAKDVIMMDDLVMVYAISSPEDIRIIEHIIEQYSTSLCINIMCIQTHLRKPTLSTHITHTHTINS